MGGYKCGYKYCTHPEDEVELENAVVIGKRKWHRACYVTQQKIKSLYYDVYCLVNKSSDYQQVVGVFNRLIFKKQRSISFVEFMIKYGAVFGASFNSPYTLLVMDKNEELKEKYKTEKERVDYWFDNRFKKNSGSKRKTWQ